MEAGVYLYGIFMGTVWDRVGYRAREGKKTQKSNTGINEQQRQSEITEGTGSGWGEELREPNQECLPELANPCLVHPHTDLNGLGSAQPRT